MNIKKHPNGNEYVRCEDLWIRNLTKKTIASLQLNKMYNEADYDLIIRNEQANLVYPKLSEEKLIFKNVLIVSDGYDFENKQHLISKMPKDVCILTVNKVLRKWQLLNKDVPRENRRTINAYVINNPYDEALNYLPANNSKYYPTCISSIRTNQKFTKKYLGDIYTYTPTFDNLFGFESNAERYYIDDYRNPICACLNLAHQFQAEKIMLFCCDDSFEEKRETAIRLNNGLWTYPQNVKAQKIIDSISYWLTHQEDNKVEIADYSRGLEYVNVSYIENEEEVISFFNNNVEGTPNET